MTKLAGSPVLLGILGSGLLFAGWCGSRGAAAQPGPDRLKTVLDEMDAGSAKFRSAEANIRKDHFEKIVSDTSTETGTIYFLRSGSSTQVGARFDPPEAQTMEYKGGVLSIYNSGDNQVQQFSAGGQNQARYEAFLALGFGGSGADLAKAWTIADQGTEQMSDGSRTVAVEKLDLVSKEASVRSNFTHITIWVDPLRDISLKQIGYTPSGDTNTTLYTKIKLNQPIDLKAFAIKCRGKCS